MFDHHTHAESILKIDDALYTDVLPLFTSETMPPVSTTAQCIINLLAQYFVIYTAIALVRTYYNFTGSGYSLVKALESCKSSLDFAPLLCVLFLAARMRAIMLSEGQTEKYDLPDPVCQFAMQLATFAVLVQLVCYLAINIFGRAGEDIPENEQGNPDFGKLEKRISAPVLVIITALWFMSLFAIYLGLAVVVYSIIVMRAPEELWGEDGAPPVAPAIAATINLCIQHCAFLLLLSLVKTYTYFNKEDKGPFASKLEICLSVATTTMSMVPMLCVLFLAARMRALQIDPKFGAPQKWAQHSFYICAGAILAQAVLAVVVPMCFTKCTVKQGSVEGDIEFIGLNTIPLSIATFLRIVAMLGLYGGFITVMCSIFLIRAKDGAPTPPISSAVMCILGLCFQYFFVYFVLFIAQTTKQTLGNLRQGTTFVIEMMNAASKTVMFAPMLSILFLMVRMRALQLTRSADGSVPFHAGPQGWAQDLMALSTLALFLQIVLVIFLSFFYTVQMDEDGNVKAPAEGIRGVGILVTILRYLCLGVLYGTVIGCCLSIFLMTPEKLPPYNTESNIVPGVKVPWPPAPTTAFLMFK